jgi:hypothetical protein
MKTNAAQMAHSLSLRRSFKKDVLYSRPLLFGVPVAVLLGVLAGAIGVSHYRREALALAAGLIIALTAAWRPKIYVIVFGAMLLVPYTWSPTLINAPTPAILLIALPAGIVGIGILMRNGQMRLCVLDWLVFAVFISSVLSEIAVGVGSGILGSHTLSHNEAEILILPYFAFRIIVTAWPQAIDALPGILIAVGVVLSMVAMLEAVMHTNLFAHASFNNPGLVVWERTYPRAGSVRADATMGHPIALGSFLVIPLTFAFGQRRWAVFLLLALGMALTLSRGPYIAGFIALLLCGVLTRQMRKIWVIVAVVAVAGIFIAPVRNSVVNSFESGTKEAKTVAYRSNLVGTSLSSLTVWGKPTGRTNELFAHQGEGNLADVTSEFALITGRQGVPGLAIWLMFFLAFIYLLREARRRRDRLLLFLGVALTAEWMALLSVALITSFQYAFWLTVAMAAARVTKQPSTAVVQWQ